MRLPWSALISALVASACEVTVTSVNAPERTMTVGSQLDAGSKPLTASDAGVLDAGEVPDAGALINDAGASTPEPDAGLSVTTDAGGSTPAPDAGFSVTDAGGSTPAPDAGSSVVSDAGGSTPAPDAGPSDSGVSESDAGHSSGPSGLDVSPHVALGVPDTASVGNPSRWLLVRPQFVVSYDTTHKVPNWSSWRLDASWLGTATRATSFRTDPLLPTGVPQARDADYTNSGFDRGHLCPSADRTATDPDNDATFYLTNVVPQTHASNAGPWLNLEDEERQLARAGKHLLIVAGPVYGATPQAIGSGVAVPLSMFKVIVVSSAPPTPATLTPATTTVYAAIIPNTTSVSGPWRQWQVTIDAVERQTGLDFLSDLPPAVQDALEGRLDR
jgi:endonuclease G, mitochondrial